MRVLAVECSTVFGSVAICESLEVLSYVSWRRKKSSAKCLIPSLSHALCLANLDFQQIDLLAVGNGPGRFTGIRVGLSAIKTLAYALNLPVVVVNSLRILAENYQDLESCTVYTLQNAFAKKIYFAQYSKTPEKCIEKKAPQVVDREHIMDLFTEPGYVLGDVQDILPQVLLESDNLDFPAPHDIVHYPQAHNLAMLAVQQVARGDLPLKWDGVEPLYLRASSAEEVFKSSRRRFDRDLPK